MDVSVQHLLQVVNQQGAKQADARAVEGMNSNTANRNTELFAADQRL